ncbi:MAG TPA: PilZ domain-containing protein, partial [Thermoanaerobaculia bacterium]
MKFDLRSEARYFVVTPLAAEIDGVNADVVDISTRGARLQVTQPVGIGRLVPFTLRAENSGVVTTASVIWCEMAALSLHDDELDRYFCGVTFEQSLAAIRELIR